MMISPFKLAGRGFKMKDIIELVGLLIYTALWFALAAVLFGGFIGIVFWTARMIANG